MTTQKPSPPPAAAAVPSRPSALDVARHSPHLARLAVQHAFGVKPRNASLRTKDVVEAGVFNKVYASALMPANEQSSLEHRLRQLFAPSLAVERLCIHPPEDYRTEYLAGSDLDHALVEPSNNVPLFILTPHGDRKSGKARHDAQGIVLYIHGGGYVRGDASGTGIAGALANRLGRRVATVDYRLATRHAPYFADEREDPGKTAYHAEAKGSLDPAAKQRAGTNSYGGAPFPAAIQDCLTAYLYLLARGERDIVLAGESAGAGCVLALLRYVCIERPRQLALAATSTDAPTRNAGSLAAPKAAILFSPLVQTSSQRFASYRQYGEFDYITGDAIALAHSAYSGLSPSSQYIQHIAGDAALPAPLSHAEAPSDVFTREALQAAFHRHLEALRHDVRPAATTDGFDYAAYPPIYLNWGDAEILADECALLAILLRERRPDVRAQVYVGPELPPPSSSSPPSSPSSPSSMSQLKVENNRQSFSAGEDVYDVGRGKRHVWVALPTDARDARPCWARMKRFVDVNLSVGGSKL